jgi:hypothetical protein
VAYRAVYLMGISSQHHLLMDILSPMILLNENGYKALALTERGDVSKPAMVDLSARLMIGFERKGGARISNPPWIDSGPRLRSLRLTCFLVAFRGAVAAKNGHFIETKLTE